MSKKDLSRSIVDIQKLASLNPANPPAPAPRPPELTIIRESRPRGRTSNADTVIQFSLSLRKGLRKQLAQLAADADMTMRAFVLEALREKGLAVRDDDLADLRRR